LDQLLSQCASFLKMAATDFDSVNESWLLFSLRMSSKYSILYIWVGWFWTYFYIFNKSTSGICYIPS
jgi:hypothetical protein